MPYLKPGSMSAMSRKQFADNRGGYNNQLKALKSGEYQPKS